MLSTITAYTNNLTSTTLTPRYEYALLKNIGAAKAKENQIVVTAKNRNEKITKKLAQEHQLFLPWKNRTPPPPSTTMTKTITTITRATPVTVRKTITR